MYPHYQGYASPCTHLAQYSEAPCVHGYFRRGCKFGFGGSHVGAFRIRGSSPIAIADHRIPACIRHAYNQTMLLQTAAG